MTLRRLKLRPRSPWRTPWQADTLTGMLLATCARVHGPNVLRDHLIEPMLAGRPPFVLSDACPGDLLPMPVWLRLADWPESINRKTLKRARWLSPEAFHAAQAGVMPSPDQLIADNNLFLDHARNHNTLDRFSDTTGDAASGFAPFQRTETLLLDTSSHPQGRGYLSVYFRASDTASANLLVDLFDELSLTGFGADTATGRGQFDIENDPDPASTLDASPPNTNGVISLSTFQPGPDDPTDGLWESFPKFGKLGPDLGLDDVRKNTIILFRPGACFRTTSARSHLGYAIPMHGLLPPSSISDLGRRDIQVIHPAFGLPIHAILPTESA